MDVQRANTNYRSRDPTITIATTKTASYMISRPTALFKLIVINEGLYSRTGWESRSTAQRCNSSMKINFQTIRSLLIIGCTLPLFWKLYRPTYSRAQLCRAHFVGSIKNYTVLRSSLMESRMAGWTHMHLNNERYTLI